MRWLRLVGHDSYEIYLFHMLIVLGLMAAARQAQRSSTALPVWTWYGVMFVLSVLLGYVVARFYSEPLNRRLRAASTSGTQALVGTATTSAAGSSGSGA